MYGTYLLPPPIYRTRAESQIIGQPATRNVLTLVKTAIAYEQTIGRSVRILLVCNTVAVVFTRTRTSPVRVQSREFPTLGKERTTKQKKELLHPSKKHEKKKEKRKKKKEKRKKKKTEFEYSSTGALPEEVTPTTRRTKCIVQLIEILPHHFLLIFSPAPLPYLEFPCDGPVALATRVLEYSSYILNSTFPHSNAIATARNGCFPGLACISAIALCMGRTLACAARGKRKKDRKCRETQINTPAQNELWCTTQSVATHISPFTIPLLE